MLPVVIDEAVQIRFELVDRETRMRSGWSPLFEEDALDGPERVLIDEEISVCLEELLQIVRSAAAATPLEFMRLVLASSQGEVRFVEVTEEPEFRRELEAAARDLHAAPAILSVRPEN